MVGCSRIHHLASVEGPDFRSNFAEQRPGNKRLCICHGRGILHRVGEELRLLFGDFVKNFTKCLPDLHAYAFSEGDRLTWRTLSNPPRSDGRRLRKPMFTGVVSSFDMSFVANSQSTSQPRRSFARWFVLVAALIAIIGVSVPAFAAEGPAHPATVEAAHGAEAHQGLPTASPEVFHIGPLPVTSSMIGTWIVAIAVLLFARYATKQMKEVPDGAQNFWEWMVEGLRDFLESIIGRQLTKMTFWFFATVFIFILFTNWTGLLPGIGTIGWGIPNEQGYLTHITTPLFRGVSADLNMTLAMALIFFVCWTYWAVKSNGFVGMFVHLFGNPARKEMKGFLAVAMAIVFVMVGCLEVISILFRPVSLSFRLYGNIFAGENLLEAMSGMIPALGWLIAVPFYFLELLVGLVQALVFMLLTAVFTVLICAHTDEHSHEGEHHH
jgi:F-type H+-transporting ATPase subunit a